MKIICYFHANKTDFHNKVFASCLVLKREGFWNSETAHFKRPMAIQCSCDVLLWLACRVNNFNNQS